MITVRWEDIKLSVLFQDLVQIAVLTLVGPRTCGLDTFSNEYVMVPILF